MPISRPIRVLVIAATSAPAAPLDADTADLSPRLFLHHAGTLAEAEAMLTASRFDAIVIDPMLPDGEGVDAVERVRRAAEDVPLVVIAAANDDPVARAAALNGEDYLLRSETDARLLHRIVRHACERAEWRAVLLRREAELRQSHKMEAVGRLAGGVAHDFNNVLTAIFGYADLLLDQFDTDDPRRADLLEIRQSAERAASLTRQLLAFGRKQVMQSKVMDLNAVIAGLHGLLGPLVGPRIVVTVHAARDLWTVKTDKTQLEQVLVNLAANARDAMPEGGILTIETANAIVEEEDTKRRPGLRPGAYVTMAVTDTGEGMSDAVRVHMFEPFFTTREQGKGTGLGLSTVYGIIKQMEGGVYAESEKGKGTRVVIYLPRVPLDEQG